jgi:hypothetical protein
MENAEPRHAMPRPTLHTNQRVCTTSRPRLCGGCGVAGGGEGGGWPGNGEKGFASCLLPFRAVDAGVFLRVIGFFDVCLVAIDVY